MTQPDTNNGRSLPATTSPAETIRELEAEFEKCLDDLRRFEALLAKEQAAVNAFRMHCRLQLGPWVEEILALQEEKQRLLTRLALLKQAEAEGTLPGFDEESWLNDRETPVFESIPATDTSPLGDFELPAPVAAVSNG